MITPDKQKLVEFIVERLRLKGYTAAIADSDSLFISGQLDSLDAITTVMFLESEFGLNFAEIGFSQTKIDSINDIAALISLYRDKA